MRNRIDRQSEAFREALDYCRLFGLDWRRHIQPKTEKRNGISEITGYYILDESMSTTLKTIDF